MGLGDIILRTVIREIIPFGIVFGVGFGCGYIYSNNKVKLPSYFVTTPVNQLEKSFKQDLTKKEEQELLKIFQEIKDKQESNQPRDLYRSLQF